MPVILPNNKENLWLNPNQEMDSIMNLLNPHPDTLMEAFTVSRIVNNVRNNFSDLIKPINTLNLFF